MTYLPYAGIGSRKTPEPVLQVMRRIGSTLAKEGFTLRSGGAKGADSAFESGALENKEIFIPWNGFNGFYESHKGVYCGWPDAETEEKAYHIARRYHPNWGACSNGAKLLHARNVAQVLGHKLEASTMSKFVVCWTPNASGSGGTGQALRIAKAHRIPIFDLGSDMETKLKELALFCEYLQTPEMEEQR